MFKGTVLNPRTNEVVLLEKILRNGRALMVKLFNEQQLSPIQKDKIERWIGTVDELDGAVEITSEGKNFTIQRGQ